MENTHTHKPRKQQNKENMKLFCTAQITTVPAPMLELGWNSTAANPKTCHNFNSRSRKFFFLNKGRCLNPGRSNWNWSKEETMESLEKWAVIEIKYFNIHLFLVLFNLSCQTEPLQGVTRTFGTIIQPRFPRKTFNTDKKPLVWINQFIEQTIENIMESQSGLGWQGH